MSDSEGKKELAGIARSIDALFSPPDVPDDDSGVETPPEPPNVSGDTVTGAPVPPDMPEDEGADLELPDAADEATAGGPPPLRQEVAGEGAHVKGGPPPLPESSDQGGDGVDQSPPSPQTATSDFPPPLPEDAASAATGDPTTPPPLPDAAERPTTGRPPPLPWGTDEGTAEGPPPWPEEVLDEGGDATDGPPPLPETAFTDAAEDAPAPDQALRPPGDADAADEPRTPLDDAVDAYLDGDRDRDRADEIRRLADEMLEERNIDPVAEAVGRLAGAAGEPPDGELVGLARDLASPVVLARLAVHLGAERDEARRQAYYVACRNLGELMGRAIRNDLAESTDRLARRVHCEALVEMGPVGRTIIEEMVDDDNRFLVRNAVAILGDTGGDGAVELVTSALANPDARVRREALRSLAKLGDEDAGDFVLGLLDDSDRDVRIQAAVTAGELHVERALRHVIKLLEETKDPDEVIPLVRALGHLGDPGAVPSIEKHAVRTLFSKPRTDVRIAAYRALSQIGTPHARRLLNQAVDDKEPLVKAAVKEMLGMG